MQPRWILARDFDLNGKQIPWPELCGSDCISRLLQRKQFACADDVRRFLNPRLATLGDPFRLDGMSAAVERLFYAIRRNERIVLFGDYDVDGVTSLALLFEILRAFGCQASLFLPHRIEEGYGLSEEAIARCLKEHDPQLLIAIDCGTSSFSEIAALRKSGVDVIVLDHHVPKARVPDCFLVNPKASDSEFGYLCSVGLVFKLCHALLKTQRIDFDLKRTLELVALGTVADIVPLQGDNRVFVKSGSSALTQSRRRGIIKLMEFAAVKPPIMPEDISFRLAPRLNAAGRLATAEKALALLLTDDDGEAERLARELDGQNRERQEVEKRVLLEAEEQLNFDPLADAAIVLGARGWHPGVLGIVASRVAKKYHRPTIIVGFDESGRGKGSGRGIEGFSLITALNECRDTLEKFGGHEMAAGVALSEKTLPLFRKQFHEAACKQLSSDALVPRLYLDAEIGFADVHFDLLHWHEQLQPFGSGNPQPIFVSCQVEPTAAPRVVGERHLAFRLKQRNWHQRGIFFDGVASPLPPPPWDVAYRICSDVYEGEIRIQLQVQALRSAAALG
ncbi:MAG TPA: single-stranded-DNA-specific exonuclease RecJ [Chthoniobacterales bacterium]